MAIKFKAREIININPIDIKPKKALGLRLPFASVGSPFVLNYTTKDQVKSNLINLLLTTPGERYNEPTFGVGIYSKLFEQSINEEILKDLIRKQTNIFIPEIEVANINVSQNEHDITLEVVFKLLANNKMDLITLTLK